MERKTPVSSYYFDALELGNMWGCLRQNDNDGTTIDVDRKFHHTLPISMLYALHAGLSMVARDGLTNCWERHRHAAEFLHKKLEEMGMELFVKDAVTFLCCC